MIKLLILMFSTLKFGKLFFSGGTMLLSMLMYSFVFGWKYAVGFVLLIFAHELGHYFAARQRGLDVGMPTFIPFVGAWIALKDMPSNAETQAYIGIAGPVAGTIASLGCYLLGQFHHLPLLIALSYSGFVINLFNLIPLASLDGGHITAVISPKIWWIGMPICIALFIQTMNPLLLMVIIFSIPQVLAGRQAMPEGYYQVSLNTRIIYSIWYLGLIVLLGVMSVEVHRMLAPYGNGHSI